MSAANQTDLSEETTPERGSYVERAAQKNTIEQKLKECQETVLRREENSSSEGYCEAVWDGVYCWPKSNAGQLINVPCPEYIDGFKHHEIASKFCTDEGKWYHNPETNNTWTNYSLCTSAGSATVPRVEDDDKIIENWLPIIKTMSQVGYAFSLVTLFIAFFILVSIKKLRCPRNTLHMHLFFSFMLRAFISLLKDSIFIDGVGLPQSIVDGIFVHDKPNWECKLVTTLWQYFIVANYTWILMEGLYLHNLIFLAPFSDSSAITLYVILGWGCPIPVVGAWVTARILLDDTLCWTTHQNNSDLFLIVRIPIIITIVLNFLFFLNIARVLLVKLQSAVSIESRKYRYRKWAKSTLVLMPLFGAHYMIFIGMSYYMGINPLIEIIWLFCDQLFASFQGCFVAILYCLLNGEVRSELGKKWKTWKTEAESKNMWIPLTHITSKFYQQRSTNDDMTNGLSATSVAAVGVAHNSTMRHPFTDVSRARTIEQELTEEHAIDLEPPVGMMKV